MKVKNVRPGILMIADAGLKLAPGESVELETLTPQARKAVDDGLLACTDKTPESKPESKPAGAESKPKGKTTDAGAENKEGSKKGKGQPAEEEQSAASEENPEQKPEDRPKESGQPQLLGTDDAPK